MSCLDLAAVERDDRAFVRQRLSCFSLEIQQILLREYLRQPTKFERNTYLRITTDNISSNLSIPLNRLELNLCEEELRANAKQLAKAVLSLRRYYQNDQAASPVLIKEQGITIHAHAYTSVIVVFLYPFLK